MTSAFVISADGKFPEMENVIEKLDGEDGNCMNLSMLQRAVDGYIAPILCNREDGKFCAFMNDEAIPQGLPKNELATRVLEYLDFCAESLYDGVAWGSVVIAGRDETGLDGDTIAVLEVLCRWFSAYDADTELPLTEAEMCCLFKNGEKRPKRPAEHELEDEPVSVNEDTRDISTKGADANPADSDQTVGEGESITKDAKIARLEETSNSSSSSSSPLSPPSTPDQHKS